MTLLFVAILVAIVALVGLVAWLVVQLKRSASEAISVAVKGMELLKASSLEQVAQVEAIRGREQLYQRQLEDAVAGKQIPLPAASTEPEMVEIVDDTGRARTIDMRKLQAIGPDDVMDFS
jgi:hypothetical protein